MQNTIVREFAGNPNVFTAVFEQGGANGETREWLGVFWSNYYLRGGILWDEDGAIGGDLYGQPSTGLPFGRGFIVDQAGRVDTPYFGHQPQMAIARIRELLGTSAVLDPGIPGAPAPGAAWGPRAIGAAPLLRLAGSNPFADAAHLVFRLAGGGRVRVEVCDAQGRRLRTLLDAWLPAGAHRAMWDGRTRSGCVAPAGVYLFRVEAAGREASCAGIRVTGQRPFSE
jgi:hypothetical protein